MKILLIFSVLVTAGSVPREGYKASYRYFKISCQSSNKTCNNPFCYLQNTRNDSTFSSGCDVITTVNRIYYQISVSYRFLSQYRYIFKWPNVELCAYMSLIPKFMELGSLDSQDVPAMPLYNMSYIKDQLTAIKDSVIERFPDKLHGCPLHRDAIKFYNVSAKYKNTFETRFPDGDYQYKHTLWNDDDDKIFQVTVHETFKTGEDAFF